MRKKIDTDLVGVDENAGLGLPEEGAVGVEYIRLYVLLPLLEPVKTTVSRDFSTFYRHLLFPLKL